MTIKLNRYRSDEVFFFLSYGLFYIVTFLSTSFYYRYFHGRPFQVVYLACVALLFLQELQYTHATRRELVGAVLAFLLFAISFLVADGALQRSVPCIFLFCFCARRIPFRKIARFTLTITVVLMAFVILSGYAGVIPNYTAIQKDRTREYLGFRYALFPAAHLLNMTAIWIYLNKEKLPLFRAALWGAANYWLYLKTDSRTSCALAILLLVFAVVLRFAPRILDWLRWVLSGAFVLCCGVSVYLTVIYDKTVPWMKKLNTSLGDRLELGQNSLTKYGVNLFGQNLDWNGNSLDAFGQPSVGPYDYVDCLYVKILQKYGFVFVILFLALLTLALIRCAKRRDLHLLLIMTAIAGHCMLDDLSMYLYYNTFWFAMGALLLNPAMLYPAEKSGERRRTLPQKRRKTRLSLRWI